MALILKMNRIKYNLISLNCIILFICNVGCEDGNVDRSTINFNPCDTIVPFAIKLIEEHDSVIFSSEVNYERSFTYFDFNEHGEIVSFKFPFLNNFHDTLDFFSIRNFYDKSFINKFDDYIFEDKTMVDFCSDEYLIINRDSVDGMRKLHEENQLIGIFEYYTLSYPLFNEDKTFLIIELDKHCYGLCGEGYTFVFKKQLKEWVLDKKIMRWVS